MNFRSTLKACVIPAWDDITATFLLRIFARITAGEASSSGFAFWYSNTREAMNDSGYEWGEKFSLMPRQVDAFPGELAFAPPLTVGEKGL